MLKTEEYRVAEVIFLKNGHLDSSCKVYSFALFDNDIVEGDYVAVETVYGICLGQVRSIVEKENYNGFPVEKEVICKLNTEAYESRKVKRNNRENLLKQMRNLACQSKEIAMFEALAEVDPQMRKLLEEFKKNEDN